jgi:hypothetical protein
MTSNYFSRLQIVLQEDDTDSTEMIVQEMHDQGLSGVADEDTWLLNSRIDDLHFRTHNRHSHSHHYHDLAS